MTCPYCTGDTHNEHSQDCPAAMVPKSKIKYITTLLIKNKMKIEMEQWEIERIKEKVSKVLEFWMYDFIEVSSDTGHKMSMSKETFLENFERELKGG